MLKFGTANGGRLESVTKVSLALALSTTFIAGPIEPTVAAAPVLKTLGPHDELSIDYDFGHLTANVRVANSYMVMRLNELDLQAVSVAPKWDLRIFSKSKKLYYDTSIDTWLRRGLNNWTSQIRYWPLVRTESTNFLKCRVGVYKLPFKSKEDKVVPLNKGDVGELYAFEGSPAPVGKLLAPIGQFPAVRGVPLKYVSRNKDRGNNAYSSVLLYSGGRHVDRGLTVKNVRLVKQSPLPSCAGFNRCEDLGKLWVNPADTEGVNELIR